MVPLWPLPVTALFLLLSAFLLANARRLSRHRMLRDGTAAMAAAVASTIAGICCYAVSASGPGGILARNIGAACVLAFPLVGAAALKMTSRRNNFPPGSFVGAFLLGSSVFVVIAAWTILYLKGPSGGWGAGETLVSTASLVLSYSAAACIGWWSSRSIRQRHA